MDPRERQGPSQNPSPPPAAAAPATPGTEHVPTINRWLPRLIISAIVINLLPSLFGLFDQYEFGETIRNYANIIFIIGFVIIIFKTVSEKH